MLLTATLRVHSLDLKVHTRGSNRSTSLLIQCGYHACVVLSDGSRHLVKVPLSGTIGGRLDLEVVASALTLEVKLSWDVLGAADRVVNLQVLQGHFLVLLLLVFGWVHIDIDVAILRTFQPALCILRPLLERLIDSNVLRTLLHEAILALVLIHNSIQRAYIVFRVNHYRLHHVELEVWLCDLALGSTFGSGRANRPLQIELPWVLILGRGGVLMDSHDCSLIKAQSIISFVPKLRVICCVHWWSSTCLYDLGRVLVLTTCLNREALNASSLDLACGRYHVILLSVRRWQVIHLQRGYLGQVSHDFLILLAILDAG